MSEQRKMQGMFYQHKRTGTVYAVLGYGQRKVEDTREWNPVIVYQSTEGHMYVREESDFYDKFTPVITPAPEQPEQAPE